MPKHDTCDYTAVVRACKSGGWDYYVLGCMHSRTAGPTRRRVVGFEDPLHRGIVMFPWWPAADVGQLVEVDR